MTMVGDVGDKDGQRGNYWRWVAWTAAGLILLLPWAAMQFTNEVDWTGADFVVAGVLLGGTGLAFEWAVRKAHDRAYRAGVGVALAAALLLVWVNLAVGIIGSEDNPANLMYAGVLVVGIGGALIAHFRPEGMARALYAAAFAQAVVAVVALSAGLGAPWSGAMEIVLLNGFFVALFVGAALLFRQAARGRQVTGTALDE